MKPEDRLHAGPGTTPSEGDARSHFERDRDRILYSSAFRRLGGVTQVVGPIEGHVFHNRLTHTLEVAQVARRLAERLVRDEMKQPESSRVSVDADVVEAAALAHDLGHPPFGHVAEDELNRLAAEAGGYEGNAQSFRIVTKLSAHRKAYRGLNLTRATLAAVLKYPWMNGHAPPGKSAKKYGAYESESGEFAFATAGRESGVRTIEADIMDHADAIAYSVHDLEDFYRAGLVPLERLVADFDILVGEFKAEGAVDSASIDTHIDGLKNLAQLLTQGGRYRPDFDGRVLLRTMTSTLINEFVHDVSIDRTSSVPRLRVPPDKFVKMKFLQRLVWKFVIKSPRLATQQFGQRRVVATLFEIYQKAMQGRIEDAVAIVPAPFHQELEQMKGLDPDARHKAELRTAADIVASFSDRQATTIFRRLSGQVPGSVMDLLES